MEKDKLEEFVRSRSAAFDTDEAPAFAWESIEKEIPAKKKAANIKLLPIIWKAAAAVLIFAAAWFTNDFYDSGKIRKSETANQTIVQDPVISELIDAEAYYTSQIQSRQQELARYAEEHPEIIAELKAEFKAMDERKEELRQDLAQSSADEKVIEAIILSYRVKLEILDGMLLEMKRSRDAETQPEEAEKHL